MTRKKSNVKALALAVTCAILAGGYSGLNPVYAAGDYGDYTVKYDATDKCLDYVTNNSSGYNTIGIYKIKLNNIVLDSSIGASPSITVGSYFSIDGSNGSINAANNNFTVSGAGAITATSLKLGSMSDVAATINSKAAQTDVETNRNTIDTLKTTVGDANGGLVKDVADNKADIAKKADQTALNTANDEINALKEKTTNFDTDGTTLTGMTEVGANKVSATTLNVGDKEITAAKVDSYDAAVEKTTNIIYDASTNTTTVNGIKFHTDASNDISDINDGIIKFSNNGSKDIVQINSDLMFNDDAGQQAATLTLEGVKTINGLSNGNSVIKAGDGSEVGGVTFDNKKITNVDSVMVNKDANNQVQINSEGIVVGLNSTVVGSDGVYAGGHTEATAKAVLGADGSIKGAGDCTGKYKFTVDGATGNVVSKGSVTANQAGFNDLAVTNGLTVGSATGDFVNMQNGNVVATGSVTAKGGLSAAGGAFNVDPAGKVTTTGDIEGKNITATGALKGQTLGIGGTGNDQFTVNADGEVQAAGGKVSIDKTGKATFGNIAGNITTIEGQKITTGSIVANDTTVESTISGVKMKNGLITADSMKITGAIDLDNLKVNNKLTVGTFSVDNTGVVTGLTSINDVAVAKNGTGLKIGSATVGDANPFKSNGFTVDATGNIDAKDITAGTYNGNTIGTDNTFNGVELKGGNVAATQVTANTITDGIATMTGGKVTANEITANTSATLAGVKFDASGVDFNNKEIKNIAKVSATTADLGKLHIEGSKITNVIDPGGGIGLGTNVTVNDAGELGGITKIDGVNVTDNAGGLAIGTGATQVTIGGANAISVGTGAFTVDGAGLVTGNQFTTTNGSYLKDNELKLNAANIWNTTEGIKAEKAVIGANTLNAAGISTTGTLDVKGQATFGNSTSGNYTTVNGGKVDITANGGTTTIEGAKITTKTLDVEDIILRNEMKDSTGATINIKGSDGSMSVAGGKFKVDANGQVTNHITATGAAAADTIFTTSETGIDATFQKNGEAASSGLKIDHNHAALNASGGAALDLKDKTATLGIGTDSLTTYTSDAIESKVGADASRTLKATEIIDAVGSTTVTTKSGGTTFGDGTANNTLIYGSSITSTNGAATGVLNGSNLTLTNGANSTALTAGGVTFTGADGRSDATGVKNQTTIDGGIITTDTLNVQRIELGDKLVDSNGTSHGSNLSMDEYGNIKAAGGNFTVAGTNQTNPGALHNEVGGKTFLDTTETGASMKYNNGTVESNVSVGDNSAKISAGASSIEVKNDGITNNGVTTFNGTTGTTKIDGGTITTNHLITDKLTITGSGAAAGAGTGTIALGGNGSIKSNIQDASGTKEATFETEFDHIKSEVKDGTTTTKNEVKASGNTNTVTEIATSNNTESYQTATSIGGVVTNGTVKMKQELTAEGVKVTDELGDPANYTQITDKDVSITDPKNTGKRINLSDLGQLNDLDGELTARKEYQDNKTAVGAINAEAGIRREEVARLDNRIDDVNNRVDKVGAMAAAIASLKSIGYDPQAPSEFSIGLGQYKGETGVAMGFFHYPNKNFMINVSLSTAGGETMGGIGATWRFGHKSPQKLLEEQREAQARKELAAAEKYQAAAKLAKEAQERAEYAAKLARQAQVSADNAKAAADATQAKHFQ